MTAQTCLVTASCLPPPTWRKQMPHPHLECQRLRTEADPFEVLSPASVFLLLSSELLLWAAVPSIEDSKPTPARVTAGDHSAEG